MKLSGQNGVVVALQYILQLDVWPQVFSITRLKAL